MTMRRNRFVGVILPLTPVRNLRVGDDFPIGRRIYRVTSVSRRFIGYTELKKT